jgi:hypothetical protein
MASGERLKGRCWLKATCTASSSGWHRLPICRILNWARTRSDSESKGSVGDMQLFLWKGEDLALKAPSQTVCRGLGPDGFTCRRNRIDGKGDPSCPSSIAHRLRPIWRIWTRMETTWVRLSRPQLCIAHCLLSNASCILTSNRPISLIFESSMPLFGGQPPSDFHNFSDR